jgi:hypothetical protein
MVSNHEPPFLSRILGVSELALVFDKLLAETFLRVGRPVKRVWRDFDLPVAMRANADCGHRAQPLDHAEGACRSASMSHGLMMLHYLSLARCKHQGFFQSVSDRNSS